jgi:hypothetical protein
MRGHRLYLIAGLLALALCAVVAVGCGGGSDTTAETTPGANAQAKVDAAVQSCDQKAEQLGGSVATTLQGACKLVGTAADQALQQGGSAAKQGLSQAAANCRNAIGQVPSKQAKDALSSLCDAIGAAQ